jgi:hypothetical protein
METVPGAVDRVLRHWARFMGLIDQGPQPHNLSYRRTGKVIFRRPLQFSSVMVRWPYGPSDAMREGSRNVARWGQK